MMENDLATRKSDELEQQIKRLNTETERFRMITEYMNDGLFIINSDGTYDYFNEQAKKMTQEPEKIRQVGDSFIHTKYYDTAGRALAKEEIPSARVLRGETLNNVRIRAERPGFTGYYSYSGCPIYNENGDLTSAVICLRDVTDIYEYEQQIHQQKQQLQSAVDTLKEQKKLLEETVKKLSRSEMQLKMASEGACVGIYAFDFETDKGIWSPMFYQIHGLEENEPVPLDDEFIYTGLHPEDRRRFVEAMKESNNPDGDGIADLEYRIIRPDGEVRWLRLRGQTHFTGEGKNKRPGMTGGAVTDVTDRILAENNVRKLSEELRSIIDSTEDLVWSVDKDYKLLYYNASFKNTVEKIFGLIVKEDILLKDVFPREYHVWTEFYERAVVDGKFQVDLKSPFDDSMFAFSFYPIYVNSEIVGITCFAKDLTERMKTEQKIVSQNSMLEMTVRERTAELQQMVRNLQDFSLALSHDVKASYREIEACAENILKKADVYENTGRILQISKDMTKFIHEIMKYEMCVRRSLVKENVNIRKIFTSVYKELKKGYAHQARLAFETGFPIVTADQTLLRQAVINILSNALKFSAKRELAIIKIGCAEKNGEYIFYVRDNGIGFDMNGASKLFNAFERLHDKDDYDGNGLGLSIVKNVVHRHGGRVWIDSEPDIGTTVWFSLPIT
jgi:PAS domain S-box-containing protein